MKTSQINIALGLSYLKKIINDQKYVVLWLTVFSFTFEFAFAWLLFEAEFSQLFESVAHHLPPSLINFLGVSIGGGFYSSQILAFGYSHPLILISLSLLPIGLSARYIAGEIEYKTFDLLMARSIYRSIIPMQLFIFIILALSIQIAALFAGTYAGYQLFSLEIDIGGYAKVAVLTLFFFISMGAISLAITTFQNERGKAVAKTVSFFVVLYFYDTVVRLNNSLEHLTIYSYFDLHQPAKLLRGQSDISSSILILVTITMVSLGVAILHFNKRDL
jgi:ABC-type transport system involved in multi-copper enzyme maturation permease subunit